MSKTILAALVALLLAAAPATAADTPSDDGAALRGAEAAEASSDDETILYTYLDRYFQRTNGVRLKAAKKLVPAVVVAARKEALDPLLVAFVISAESTWDTDAVGKTNGEVGLMQLHGEATKGFDVSTVEGNLTAGCRWLASRIEKYGSVARGMMAYIGFNERAKKRAEWRMRAYYAERQRQGLDAAEESTLAAVAPPSP